MSQPEFISITELRAATTYAYLYSRGRTGGEERAQTEEKEGEVGGRKWRVGESENDKREGRGENFDSLFIYCFV
jgi:hypothetical protein